MNREPHDPAALDERCPPDVPPERRPGERIMLLALAATLVGLGAVVLSPFAVPLAWAVILGYVTWPALAAMRHIVTGRNASALAFTCLVAAVIAAPALWITVPLKNEVVGALGNVDTGRLTETVHRYIDTVRKIPAIGPSIGDTAAAIVGHPERLLAPVGGWLREQSGYIFVAAGGIGRNLLKLGVAFFTLFFLYREGDRWFENVRTALARLLGRDAHEYVAAAQGTVKGVVYGLLVTAIAQGVVAGVGYWFAGVPAPTLLGALTALAALLPYGAIVVWGIVTVGLGISGDVWAAVALAAWCALVVSSIDNIIRPLVISKSTHIHILVATLGVLGGATAFGLVGIFVGPVILSLLLVSWRTWLSRCPTTEGDAQAVAPGAMTPVLLKQNGVSAPRGPSDKRVAAA